MPVAPRSKVEEDEGSGNDDYDDDEFADLPDAPPPQMDPDFDYDEAVWEAICKSYEGTELLEELKERRRKIDEILERRYEYLYSRMDEEEWMK